MDDKFNKLNELYSRVAAFQTIWDDATKTVAALFDIKETYQNPFHADYDLRKVIRELRKDLVDFTIEQMRASCPNLSIDNAAVTKHLNEQITERGFDVQVIATFIDEQYISKADTLSLDEMLTKARHRLPVIWGDNGRKELQVADIVHKDKVILRCYADWANVDKYGGKPTINYNVIGELSAFEKLVNPFI